MTAVQIHDEVRQAQLEEQTTKAKALFRLFRRKLSNDGLDMVPIEEVIREGKKVDAILQQIAEDEDIAILVLGASKEATGPGPLVSSLGAGSAAGKFPIPITVVPGELAIALPEPSARGSRARRGLRRRVLGRYVSRRCDDLAPEQGLERALGHQRTLGRSVVGRVHFLGDV